MKRVAQVFFFPGTAFVSVRGISRPASYLHAGRYLAHFISFALISASALAQASFVVSLRSSETSPLLLAGRIRS